MIFASIPATVRILAVFAVILIAIRKKIPLGAAFFLGAVLLGLIFGMSPLGIIKTTVSSFLDPKTLSLAAVVCLILVLSHSMEAAGQMERLLERFRGLIRRPAVNLTVFPALIGLLPMPGGAIFSAPMVKTLGKRHGLSGAQLSFINYWFRHIWEYWWPLYPGVLLATTLAGINLWVFVGLLIPLTGVAVAAGSWPLWGMMKNTPRLSPAPRPPLGPFLIELVPILTVIILGLGSGTFLSAVLDPSRIPITKELGLILALMTAIGWVWRHNRLPAAKIRLTLTRPDLLRMFLMVAAILIFKGILEDSQAVAAVSREMVGGSVPLIPITIILPFLVGGVTGITVAFVGTTFPILISLIGNYGAGHLLLPYLLLGMVSGFVGVLLSPLHLCLILSNAYFDTTFSPVYRYLIPLCAALLTASLVYFIFLT